MIYTVIINYLYVCIEISRVTDVKLFSTLYIDDLLSGIEGHFIYGRPVRWLPASYRPKL